MNETSIWKNCQICKKPFKVQLYRKDTAKCCSNKCKYENNKKHQWNKGKKHSLITKQKIKQKALERFKKEEMPKGEKSYNWKGGTSENYYRRLVKYNLIKICYFCNKKNSLVIHHIDLNHHNNKLSNLIILCKSCHTKIHHILRKGDKD